MHVSHQDAVYNCAAELLLVATVTGSKIVVNEEITNPKVQANCFCPFDLATDIQGLAPGTYSVELYDADGTLVGSASVVLP